MTQEIRLKLKYRIAKPVAKAGKSNYGGNSGKSSGKGPHPDVPGFRKKGYKCEGKWNPKA